MVYELSFFYWDENPQNDDEIVIAVYSSYELAEKGLKKFAQQPRFKGKEEALYICEYNINQESRTWSEGFFEAGPTFWGIDLSKGYRLRKFEGNNIAIRVNDSEESIFSGKMHYYQDFEECLLLKNQETEKMYCFDKDQEAILKVTESDEEFSEYLKENYNIEKIKWKLIYDER